jgi:heme-degrading monooxygenase HmoA
MMGKILTWATGLPTTIHAALKPFPPPVETAPVVEWCTVTLSPGTSKEDYIVSFKEFEKGLNGAGYKWHSSGWVVEKEKERDYLLLIGWDSVKAHADWRASEAGQAAVGYLKRGVDNVHMVHINYGGDIPKEA